MVQPAIQQVKFLFKTSMIVHTYFAAFHQYITTPQMCNSKYYYDSLYLACHTSLFIQKNLMLMLMNIAKWVETGGKGFMRSILNREWQLLSLYDCRVLSLILWTFELLLPTFYHHQQDCYDTQYNQAKSIDSRKQYYEQSHTNICMHRWRNWI